MVGHNPVIGLLLTMADVSTIMLHLLMRLLASNLSTLHDQDTIFTLRNAYSFFPLSRSMGTEWRCVTILVGISK